MFVFDILQICSGCFAPPWLWAWFIHRVFLFWGFLHHDELVYSDMSEKPAEVSTRTKCIRTEDEAASPSAMSIIFLYTV